MSATYLASAIPASPPSGIEPARPPAPSAVQLLQQELGNLLATPARVIDQAYGHTAGARERKQWVLRQILQWAQQEPSQLDVTLSPAQLAAIETFAKAPPPAASPASSVVQPSAAPDLQAAMGPTNDLLMQLLERLNHIVHPAPLAELGHSADLLQHGMIKLGAMMEKLSAEFAGFQLAPLAANLQQTCLALREVTTVTSNAARNLERISSQMNMDRAAHGTPTGNPRKPAAGHG